MFASCQSQDCNCDGFVNWRSDKLINVYSDSNGEEKIAELQNELDNENFLAFSITESKGRFFKVLIGHTLDNDSDVTGWIKKEAEIGTNAGHYSDNYTLKLYTKPSIKSKVKFDLTNMEPRFGVILDCSEDWVYVRLNIENKIFEGWLEPTMQCPSVYTTCN